MLRKSAVYGPTFDFPPTIENGSLTSPADKKYGAPPPRVPPAPGGGSVDGGGPKERAPWPSGCHPHAPGLPAWTAGLGAREPPLGASGPYPRPFACPPQETRHPLDPSLAGPRTSGIEAPAARLPGGTPGVCLGAGRALERLLGPADTHSRWGARRPPLPGPPPHAAPCVWVQARQRRPRYPRYPALTRAPQHPAHGALHRAGGRPLQGVLEGVSLPGSPSGLSVDPRPCLHPPLPAGCRALGAGLRA